MLLRCERLEPPMSQMGHERRFSPLATCPLNPPIADMRANLDLCRAGPCMDGARGAREKSDLSAKRSGAAMYAAFECGRCGRWP